MTEEQKHPMTEEKHRLMEEQHHLTEERPRLMEEQHHPTLMEMEETILRHRCSYTRTTQCPPPNAPPNPDNPPPPGAPGGGAPGNDNQPPPNPSIGVFFNNANGTMHCSDGL